MRARRILVAALALLLLASCGGETAAPPAAPVPVSVFLVRDGQVAPVRRLAPEEADRLGGALDALFAGPAALEAQAGYSSSVPAGTRLRGVTASPGSVRVDLSAEFASGGGSTSVAQRLAQLVYTATQLDPSAEVTFTLEGRSPILFSGEGLVVDHPVTRDSYESLTPPVLVLSPLPGDRVKAPVRVEGTANVFEGQFSIDLAAAEQTTTVPVRAASGTGTRGAFSIALEAGGYTGPAHLVAWDASPKDGSRVELATLDVVVAA